MSGAQTFAEFHERFSNAVNSGLVEAILDLYEDGATFVTGPGTSVTGKAAIREALNGFLALNPRLRFESSSTLEGGGDLALLQTRWVMDGSGPTGFPMQLTGTAREVLRRGPDGSWRYVIDDPGIA